MRWQRSLILMACSVLALSCGGRRPSNVALPKAALPEKPDLFSFVAGSPSELPVVGFAIDTTGLEDIERRTEALVALFERRLAKRFVDHRAVTRSGSGLRGAIQGARGGNAAEQLFEELERPVLETEMAQLHWPVPSRDACRPPSTASSTPFPSANELENFRRSALTKGRVALSLRDAPAAAKESRRIFDSKGLDGPRVGTPSPVFRPLELPAEKGALLLRAEGASAPLRSVFFSLTNGRLRARLLVDGITAAPHIDYSGKKTCLSISLTSRLGRDEAVKAAGRAIRSWAEATEQQLEFDRLALAEDFASIGLSRERPLENDLTAPYWEQAPTDEARPETSLASFRPENEREMSIGTTCRRPWFVNASDEGLVVALAIAAKRTMQARALSLDVAPSTGSDLLALKVKGGGSGPAFGRALADIWIGTDLRRSDLERAEAIVAMREREWSPAFRELVRMARGGQPVALSPSAATSRISELSREPLRVVANLDPAAARAFSAWAPDQTSCATFEHRPLRGMLTFESSADELLFAFEAPLPRADLERAEKLLGDGGILSRGLGPLANRLSVRAIGEGAHALLVIEATPDTQKSLTLLVAQLRTLVRRIQGGGLTEQDLRTAVTGAGLAAATDETTRAKSLLETVLNEEHAVLLVGKKSEGTKKPPSATPPGRKR